MRMEYWGNDTDKETRSIRRDIRPIATFPTTCSGLELNLGFRDKSPAKVKSLYIYIYIYMLCMVRYAVLRMFSFCVMTLQYYSM